MRLKTIKELHEKIQSGEIDESKLEIVLDNDCTSFNIMGDYNEDEGDYNKTEIDIEETNGYNDIEPLYKLLFPKADIRWC